jgi:cytidine deaminase
MSELIPKKALVHMHYGDTLKTVKNEDLLPWAFSEDDL